MLRYEVVQYLLDLNGRGTYVEIGVEYGKSFIPIKAKRKLGIDPDFRDLMSIRVFSFLKSRKNLYFQMTSSEFFDNHSDLFSNAGIDVAFVDGRHTHGQSLEDVLNCLSYLNENGFVVAHDCNPVTEAMAYPSESYEAASRIKPLGWTGEWSGDVWKTIVHLRSTRNDLDVCVLDCDYGVGIISKGAPKLMLPGNLDPKNMAYADLEKQRAFLLNLKKPDYLYSLAGRAERGTLAESPIPRAMAQHN